MKKSFSNLVTSRREEFNHDIDVFIAGIIFGSSLIVCLSALQEELMYLVVSLAGLATLLSLLSGFIKGLVVFGLIFIFVYKNLEQKEKKHESIV